MKSPRNILPKVVVAHETFRLPASTAMVWMQRGELLGRWLKERFTAWRRMAPITKQVGPRQPTA